MADERTLELLGLLRSEYTNVAKLSKFVEVEVKKLQRIVTLRSQGISEEFAVLHSAIAELRGCPHPLGFEVSGSVLPGLIRQLNRVIGFDLFTIEMIIRNFDRNAQKSIAFLARQKSFDFCAFLGV